MNQNSANSKSTDPSMIGWPAPLLDTACAIASQKWIVLVIVALGIVFGGFRLLTLPKVYKASAVAVLMPREKPNLDASIDTSSLETSDDRASRSTSGNLMLPPNPTLYTTMINSRAVIEQLAQKFASRLNDDLSHSEDVYLQLKSMITVISTEEGLITVTVTSASPSLSADIANEIFEECKRASKSIERQLLLQQAGHLEGAFANAAKRLAQTELRLKDFTAKYGVIDFQLQASNQLRSIRELSVKRDDLKSDLQEMRLHYAEQSPEVARIKARIAAIESQQNSAGSKIVGDTNSRNYGALVVEHESLKQRIRFERDLVATLTTKADIYRIRAEEPTGNLAVIRPASSPTRPSGPSKKREIGIALGLSIALAIAWTLTIDQWRRARRNRYIDRRLHELRDLVMETPSWIQAQPVIDIDPETHK
ncbi:MAG: hypothetical protein F6K21_17770 [Symploca sp. SIO2D2]|nr:hypothetical protein [Symploca sp. SIO2D2]